VAAITLNLDERPWSPSSVHAPQPDRCALRGPEATLVIDDATGAILGVYPGNRIAPHPSP